TFDVLGRGSLLTNYPRQIDEMGFRLHRINPEPPMSALGQKQTSALVRVMSALPPKADIALRRSECPLCANSGQSAVQQKRLIRCSKRDLFNDLVSDAEQSRREAEAECLGGFEVDHQFGFGWLLDRQIGWLGALENAVDVPCRVAEFFGAI